MYLRKLTHPRTNISYALLLHLISYWTRCQFVLFSCYTKIFTIPHL